MNNLPHLFLDLDGVLANFSKAATVILGADPEKVSRDTKWARLSRIPDFYNTLELMEDAMELWSFAKPYNPSILTGVSNSMPNSEAEKRVWVARLICPEVKVICCLSKNKAHHMKRGDVLVDDRTKYADLWLASGGEFVHHKSAAQSIQELRQLGYK